MRTRAQGNRRWPKGLTPRGHRRPRCERRQPTRAGCPGRAAPFRPDGLPPGSPPHPPALAPGPLPGTRPQVLGQDARAARLQGPRRRSDTSPSRRRPRRMRRGPRRSAGLRVLSLSRQNARRQSGRLPDAAPDVVRAAVPAQQRPAHNSPTPRKDRGATRLSQIHPALFARRLSARRDALPGRLARRADEVQVRIDLVDRRMTRGAILRAANIERALPPRSLRNDDRRAELVMSRACRQWQAAV